MKTVRLSTTILCLMCLTVGAAESKMIKKITGVTEVSQFWNEVAAKRKARVQKFARGQAITIEDYVQRDPPTARTPRKPTTPQSPLPDINDFIRLAQQHFNFTPDLRPEEEFKRAYVKAAVALGITREQVVRIYGFEDAGTGRYDTEAGREYSPTAPIISTAVGYNQVLRFSTLSLLADKGRELVLALRQNGVAEQKIKIVQQMIAFAKTVPNSEEAFQALAITEKGTAVHALILDIDAGPLLQAYTLTTSLQFARSHCVARDLTAVELELMNLSGDFNGCDMIRMSQELCEKVKTANFFAENGWWANKTVRVHNTVCTLKKSIDDEMDRNVRREGARQLDEEFSKALDLRK